MIFEKAPKHAPVWGMLLLELNQIPQIIVYKKILELHSDRAILNVILHTMLKKI